MSNKWYNDIQSELIDREQQCNDKVVYEYTRPKTNPYSYNNVDEFKESNPYSTDKNCKILITDKIYKQDKYNRYYKDIYTKNKCKATNGFWVGETINRNNTYDNGNCWVNDEDAECGSLLDNHDILRNIDITRQELKTAKNKCEINPKCSFKQINNNSRDCISNKHVPEKLNVKKTSSSISRSRSRSRSRSSNNTMIDINNLEKSLYDYYNNKNAPKTLALIGKGNRCVENPEEESESESYKSALSFIDNIDNIDENIQIEELSLANLVKYTDDYIHYMKYIIIGLNPNYEEYEHKILNLFFNKNKQLFNEYLIDFKLYEDEIRKRALLGAKYKPDKKYQHMWLLYYEYFPNFFRKENDDVKRTEANKYIYFQYMKNYILNLNPNDESENLIILNFINDSANFNDFLQEYNDSKGTNNIDIYYTYFPNYFITDIAYKNRQAKKGYDKYVKIIIYNADPNNEDDYNTLIGYMYEPEKFDEFKQAYNNIDRDNNNNKLKELYFTYFPDFFDLYESNIIEKHILYIQNKIKLLDPNIATEYEELKKYIEKDALLSEYKKKFNLIDIDDEESLNDLYEIYFPTYFKQNITSISSFYNSSILSSSYVTAASSLSTSSKKTNAKLPTVPQSIVNNICKIINTQKLDKRGMLLWHSTGSGKTCTATAIMDGFIGCKKRIIYCSSVDALINNPPNRFHECAANLFPHFYGKSLDKIKKEFAENKIEFFTFAMLANRIEKKLINLNECILIIDEVHNLFRPLSHQKKQYAALEKILLNPDKIPKLKVFILTATLGDNPKEIMKLLNIVKDVSIPEIKYEDIEDPVVFKQKIRGIISYFDMSSDITKFPVVIESEPKIVNMSLKQFEKYITAYKDIKEGVKDYDKLAHANSLNKYWAPARKYSNMLYNFDKGLTLHDYSAKLEALINTVTTDDYKDDKHYIYSAFYENRGYGGQGILAIAKEFIKLGYEQLTPAEAVRIYNDPTEDNKKPRYILAITTQLGNDKGKDLDQMRALYNAPFNRNGEYVKLFLASQTFNEGLDLKAVRHIHIFEPLITWASDKQTIGRAARYCSHSDLNKKDWNVTIHRYISNFPEIPKEEEMDLDRYERLKNLIEEETKNMNTNKSLITGYKKLITDTKKKLLKNKDDDELLTQLEQLNLEVDNVTLKNDNIKNILKEYKTELKNIEKIGKKQTKPKKGEIIVDASNIDNIDKFIYKQSQEKMKGILLLYQYMQESAIDCLVLQKFHESGNKKIKCDLY